VLTGFFSLSDLKLNNVDGRFYWTKGFVIRGNRTVQGTTTEALKTPQGSSTQEWPSLSVAFPGTYSFEGPACGPFSDLTFGHESLWWVDWGGGGMVSEHEARRH